MIICFIADLSLQCTTDSQNERKKMINCNDEEEYKPSDASAT